MIAGQVKALLALKFTLLKNAWMRGQRLSFILTAVVALLIVLAGLAMAAGLFALGVFVRDRSDAPLFLLIAGDVLVCVFLFAWCASLLAELQRSEVIDFRKMLFLPVPLRLVFLFNFVASLISPALVLFALPLAGLAAGLAWSLGPRMLWVLPLGVAFYFMLAGWTYYLRGILVFLMENKRRRRTILVLIPMFFAVLGQLPSLLNMAFLSSDFGHRARRQGVAQDPPISLPRTVDWRRIATVANACIPLGWLPYGAMKLAEGGASVPALAFLGLTGLGAAGLGVGYRSTLRFYTGKRRRAVAPSRPGPDSNRNSRTPAAFLTRRLPGVDDETSALTLASFLGYVRHPQVRVQLVFPIVIGLIMLLYLRAARIGSMGELAQTIAPVGVALWPVLMMAQFIFNVFGLDTPGFRALVLLPTERRKIFVARNLALLPVTAGIGAVFVLLSAFFIHYGPMTLVQALFQIVQTYLIFCMLGNYLSVQFPYRIRYQGRQPMQSGGSSRILVALLMFPLIAAVFILSAVPGVAGFCANLYFAESGRWVGALISLSAEAVLLLITIMAYAVSLGPAGARLMAREQNILETLAKDRE